MLVPPELNFFVFVFVLGKIRLRVSVMLGVSSTKEKIFPLLGNAVVTSSYISAELIPTFIPKQDGFTLSFGIVKRLGHLWAPQIVI